MIIKHWREDWEYEKKDWWAFSHNAVRNHVSDPNKDVSSQWMQTVWEVDDTPLPRREYTKRSDYNVVARTNRIIITDTGWVHEQASTRLLQVPPNSV